MKKTVFPLVFFVALLAAVSDARADDKTAKGAPAASGAVQNTAFYDEGAYDWPGSPATGKVRVATVKVRAGMGMSPVFAYGDCVFIDGAMQEGQEYSLSLKTAEDWAKFKSAPPNFLTLTACCPRASVPNPCSSNPKILSTDRVSMIRTVAFNNAYLEVFQCMPAQGYRGTWQRIGANAFGGCPNP